MFRYIVFFVVPATITQVNCDTWTFPDVLAGIVTCPCPRVSGLNVSLTKVHYYNYPAGVTEAIVYGIDEAAASILSRFDFNRSHPFDIFVNGYNTTIDNAADDNARCIYSQLGSNTIIIDHFAYTNTDTRLSLLNFLADYERSVYYAKSIGHAIGKLLCELMTVIDVNNINVVGHSLGAHMVGFAGTYTKENCGSLPVIYGTDPAGPCYEDCQEEHIQSGQADVVVTVKCTNTLGSTLQLADYNYIANDGDSQPGCPANNVIGTNAEYCYHFACVSIILNQAVRSSIWNASKCSDIADTVCDGTETELAGYREIPSGDTGKYRFNISSLVCNRQESYVII